MKCAEPIIEMQYRVANYGIRLLISEKEHYCLTKHGKEIVLGIGLESIEHDIRDSILGEVIAPLILLKPLYINGEEGLVHELFCSYYTRLVREEYKYLEKMFQKNTKHLYISKIYPIVARISRLQIMYTWLKLLFSEQLRDPNYYKWLSGLANLCLNKLGIYSPAPLIELDKVIDMVKAGETDEKAIKQRLVVMTRVAADLVSPSLLQAIPTQLIMDSISHKPHPLLRDPLLLVRLDSARVATKLVGFYDQLYALTGLHKLLAASKPVTRRAGMVRSVVTVEVGGIRPAVVKRYRDITAFKWLVAAILSLPLPKPLLGTLARLNNEYYYNRLLSEHGYKVPSPILIDPRRRMAAYAYIDGRDLSTFLQQGEMIEKLYYSVGQLLASLHRDGVSLWDANPSNFIYAGDELYLVDLEQAREARTLAEKAFDIAVALFYSFLYNTKDPSARARALAEGYLDAGGGLEILTEAAKYKYMAPFLTSIPVNVLEKARKSLLRVALDNS